ncbi:MAG: class I SAM-dependent methyltransferase [Acidimicrobiales bacterium]|nr:class I SAM-dependent methyltransferase [Acidimicrobiales bacterium]
MVPSPLRRRVRAALVGPGWHRAVPAPLRRALGAGLSLADTSAWLAESGVVAAHERREDLYAAVRDGLADDEPLDYLEFGVSTGASLRWWSAALHHPATRLVGFDTFEGLPEDWGKVGAGAFTAGGRVPDIDDDRIDYVVGLFQDTLGPWLETAPVGRRTIVHLDADLYSSTLFVLASLAPRLRPGDVLVFDEFGSVRNADHEFRAFRDFTTAFGWSYEPLGATTAYKQVALRVAR